MPLLLLAVLVVAVRCGSANAIAPPPAQPPAVGTFEDLPGNEICVSCNVTLAFLVLAIELAILWPLTGTANSNSNNNITLTQTLSFLFYGSCVGKEASSAQAKPSQQPRRW